MLTVCTKGLRVTQFQFSVCMYCTCGRIDNKTLLDVIHSAGRYSEESSRIHSGINNISVKSCEKHSNSVKATDIRTNATDVETRRNIVQ